MFYIPLPHPVTPPAQGTPRDAQVRAHVELLEGRLERTLMICEALWQMLKENSGYSDEALLKRVAEIDLRDGRLDGRVAPTEPKPCPHCGRTMAKHRIVCLYCGKPSTTDLFQR